ncbi:MAG TPA: DsbA family oxidoreductase [Burkholderiales bacterium]|nr:DsbA family oxidoreductase [Burkholderiales bacterium]
MTETAQDTATMRIDIVSDVVCPWCIIGYKQLEIALHETGTPAEIHWHPFELNPHMPEEGEDLQQHLAAKYGSTPEDSHKVRARLTAMGSELGFSFNYADDMRIVNTFRAHQLLHWAGAQGREHDLKMALFAACFTHQQNVNDPDVLADTAASVGLDRDEALAVLRDARFADAVRGAERVWTERGIQGVPAMIFNQKYLVTGAQGIENFTSVLRQLAEEFAT